MQLFEQARILDCDCGLVREGFQESDMLVLERTHLGPAHHNRAERLPLVNERYGKDSPVTEAERELPPIRKILVRR